MKYYTNSLAPLRSLPAGAIKLLDIPAGHVVNSRALVSNVIYNGIPTQWRNVEYDNGTSTRLGWVYNGLLDALTESPQVLSVPHPTANPQDAAQYMVYLGNVQYNLCGEFCVVYCSNEPDIEGLLFEWKAKAPSFFNRIFSGGRSRGTDLGDLDSMLSVLGFETPSLRYNVALMDPVLRRPIVTPERVHAALQDFRIISSCHISGLTGALRGQGILHWVVLEAIEIEGLGRARVTCYNPFRNVMENYSWAEYVGSMGQPYGVLVAR
jgi:hypothetical protein